MTQSVDKNGKGTGESASESASGGGEALALSVLVPVRDEAENVRPLLDEIDRALGAETAVEYIFIDDGSRDGTLEALRAARADLPRLRILRHGQSCGQSRAILSGLRAARGALIAVLDGDGQNDPGDLPALLAHYRAQAALGRDLGMVGGVRAKRHDSTLRRLTSRVANAVNRSYLRHDGRDTGCGLKLVPRALFLRLPYFDHMHRFMPALIAREGRAVDYLPVNHRPRERGRSKYGLFDRLGVGIVDLFGVRWLQNRSRIPDISEE